MIYLNYSELSENYINSAIILVINSMDKLNSFDSLTGKQEDLLNTGYCFGNLGILKMNIVNNNLTFCSKITQQKDQKIFAWTWVGFSNDFFSLRHKRSTEKFSRYCLEITPKDYIKDLKITCDCKLWDNRKDPSVSLDYAHEKAVGKIYLGAEC